jgi:hypothetical protein
MSEHTDKFPRYLADSMVMSAMNSAHGLSGRKIEDGSWIVTDHHTFTVWITRQDILNALVTWAQEIQTPSRRPSDDELDLADAVLNRPGATSDHQINDEMGYATVILDRAVRMVKGRDERERRLNTIAESLAVRGITATREITGSDSTGFPEVAHCASIRVLVEGGRLDLIIAPEGACAPFAAVGCDDDPWELPTLAWLHSDAEVTDYIDTVL